MREIKQIEGINKNSGGILLVALCEDGSIWGFRYGYWERLRDIPDIPDAPE
ncbi:MAG: hypothetical protein R3321_07730 [Nitrososphaeraceae archaeon]|nr:hypothetical protein [Nitrososphaeraceae archaeon]